MMDEQPEDIVFVTLDCVLMPNGEIISKGKTIGMFKDFCEYLTLAQ